jgi:hypothetical protein
METPSGPPVREKVHSRSRGGAAARRGGRTALRIIQVTRCCHWYFTSSLSRRFRAYHHGFRPPEKQVTQEANSTRYHLSLQSPYKDFVYAVMADYITATIVLCQYPRPILCHVRQPCPGLDKSPTHAKLLLFARICCRCISEPLVNLVQCRREHAEDLSVAGELQGMPFGDEEYPPLSRLQ